MRQGSEKSPFMFPALIRAALAAAGVLIGFFLARAFITHYSVSDDSMLPNYKRGDLVLVLKHVSPSVGDAVLVRSPVEPDRALLKRVVGTEGDFIELRNKVLYRNNQKYSFKWKTKSVDNRVFPMSFTQRDNMPAVKIERRAVFVIGDNLDYSFDSRGFGPVDGSLIIGRVIFKL